MAILTTLALGLTATAIVQWRAAAHEARIEAAYPPEGDFITVDGAQIHYVQLGQGPDLVLIHGASGSTRDMTFQFAAKLTDRYRVTIFDRPGMGYSDHTDPSYGDVWTTQAESPAEQGRILQSAADRLGVVSPILLGHSFGGAVALGWALERPDSLSGLLILSGVSNPWPGELDRLYRVIGSQLGGALVPPLAAAIVTDEYVNGVVDSIFAPQAAPEGYSTTIGASLALRRGMMRANARQVNGVLPHIRTMVPRYAGITAPTIIMHGDADTIVPQSVHADKLVTQIPQSELIVLPGIGHMPHHVAAPAVIAAIDSLFARAQLR